MIQKHERTIGCAAVLALIGVALGAFGAHALKEPLEMRGMTQVWKTAVDYQMWHALALMLVGLLEREGRPLRSLQAAAWAFAIGIILFSGSLYWLSMEGPRWIGPITPIGGLSLVFGWASVALSCFRTHESD